MLKISARTTSATPSLSLVALVGALAITLLLFQSAQSLAEPESESLDSQANPDAYQWDFSMIYASWEAWEAGMAEMNGKVSEYVALKGTLE